MIKVSPKACVIGHPIAHSRSPMIHGYWLKEFGIAGQYERQDVLPEHFSDFIRSLRANGYVGCNVTLPHKEAAFKLLDRASPRARQLQVANTRWFEGETLYGDNTDSEGFLANLDDRAPHWSQNLKKAVVLGAGGASASVIAGLLERGAKEIALVNRTLQRAEQLATRFGPTVHPTVWEAVSNACADADILVNTTSLGMKGQSDLEIDLAMLPMTALVSDIVYVPLETGLLRQARRRGNPVADGLGMLLHQAVPGFEHWFGQRPVVTLALRTMIEADIKGSMP
jgi:shikimate dehydrogenase